MNNVEVLLFDLGGVVFGIDFVRAFEAWSSLSTLSRDQIQDRFSFDDAYQQHERGEIGQTEYFEHLRNTLALEGSDRDIASGWNAIFTGEIAESVDNIRRAAEKMPCFAFSNSNPTHHAWWSSAYPGPISLFRDVFVSSDLGIRKPERDAFDLVAANVGVAPQSILFFDDTLENVTGARDAGLQAQHVESASDLNAALNAIGAL